MPEYAYKAITSKGQIVRNKVEDASRQSLIQKLKNHDLTPIQIVQTSYRSKSPKRVKKNVSNIKDIMNTNNSTLVLNQEPSRAPSLVEAINLRLAAAEKITTRDIMVFTQNFYLLKKANFNNIHALNTIIQSTENLSLKGILEDILAGVETRRLHIHYNGILFKYIPTYLHKYDKSRGVIWITCKCLGASSSLPR